MIYENVIGNYEDKELSGKPADYVDFEWHELHKKLHRKVSRGGEEFGLRLGDWVLEKGLKEGDVLGETEQGKLLIVHVLPGQAIVVRGNQSHPGALVRAAYEIGNTHGALFFGNADDELLTPYSEPVFQLLSHIHGVTASSEERTFDSRRAVSTPGHGAGHSHHHGE